MTLFRTEESDWREGQNMCRGAGTLTQLVDEMRNGRRSSVHGVVGGFSSRLATCRHFSRHKSSGDVRFDPPAVFVGQQYEFKGRYPEMTEVCYDADWLRERPSVVEALQTLPDEGAQRSLDSKVSSALGFNKECEIVFPGQSVVEYPQGRGEHGLGQGDIHVYISDLELEDLYYSGRLPDSHNYNLSLESLDERLDAAVQEIDKMVPMETPVATIKVFACPSTYNLKDENCLLYSTIDRYVQRRRAKSK